MDHKAAAARLGVPEYEVEKVEAAGDGELVTTVDGVTYHVSDELVAYHANYPPDTFFPVHEPPAAAVGAVEAAGSEPSPDEDEEEVPEGTAGMVLAWVNRDQARAARALKAERDRDEPRSTLVAQLERLATP